MPDDVTRDDNDDDDITSTDNRLRRLELRLNAKNLDQVFDRMETRTVDLKIPIFSEKSGLHIWPH